MDWYCGKPRTFPRSPLFIFHCRSSRKKFRIISASPSIDSSAFEDAPSVSQSRNL